jgi:hypothetical protein
MNMTLSQRARRNILLACLAVSLVCVVYPIYVIRPFRAQGPRELAAALLVMRFQIVLTLISALTAVGVVVMYWRSPAKIWRKILATLGGIFVCVLAALARVNVYEALMFHPVDHPAFAAVNEVKIDKDDKMLVVKVGGSARAYPIRTMGYHHVVNDFVGGTAIAATY